MLMFFRVKMQATTCVWQQMMLGWWRGVSHSLCRVSVCLHLHQSYLYLDLLHEQNVNLIITQKSFTGILCCCLKGYVQLSGIITKLY